MVEANGGASDPRKILDVLDQHADRQKSLILQEASVSVTASEPSPDELPLPPEVGEHSVLEGNASSLAIHSARMSSSVMSAATSSRMNPDYMISDAMRRLDAMLAQIKEAQADLLMGNSNEGDASVSGDAEHQ